MYSLKNGHKQILLQIFLKCWKIMKKERKKKGVQLGLGKILILDL